MYFAGKPYKTVIFIVNYKIKQYNEIKLSYLKLKDFETSKNA
jgi:hypothetical protein